MIDVEVKFVLIRDFPFLVVLVLVLNFHFFREDFSGVVFLFVVVIFGLSPLRNVVNGLGIN